MLLKKEDLGMVFKNLSAMDYATIGPVVKSGAIALDRLDSVDDLPIGYRDEQSAGSYRLFKGDSSYFFGFSNGPHSLKLFLTPPIQSLYTGWTGPKGLNIKARAQEGRFAFVGVRACDLKALAVLDRVFEGESFYAERRRDAFIIALNCAFPSDVCFCPSMDAGPEVTSGFDILLTEFDDSFLMETGTDKGLRAIAGVPYERAGSEDLKRKASLIENARTSVRKSLDREGLPGALYRELENPRWADIASRDLSCGNCTMVCPTCFCNTARDISGLDGTTFERIRKWDSCYSVGFGRVHGGNFRPSRRARYRQWMTHKLAYWLDQYGVSGCVGCGRCIAWCPAGIDIVEEYRAIRG